MGNRSENEKLRALHYMIVFIFKTQRFKRYYRSYIFLGRSPRHTQRHLHPRHLENQLLLPEAEKHTPKTRCLHAPPTPLPRHLAKKNLYAGVDFAMD